MKCVNRTAIGRHIIDIDGCLRATNHSSVSAEVSIGVQKGPPIGVQKGPPSSSSVTGMTGALFVLVAA